MDRSTGSAPAGGLKPGRARAFAAGLALLALAILAYAPAFGAEFISDDVTVTENVLLRSLDGLSAIWLEPGRQPYEAHYWPLTYTTFWVEYQLFGLQPVAYQTTNVLLHALVSLLAWRILLRIGAPGAWLGGALFAVHPVHAESVAWMVERKDVLSALFFLVAFGSYVRSVQTGSRPRYVLALAAFACALLSKSAVIGLPIVLGLWDWWRRERLTARDVARWTPFFGVALLYAVFDVRWAWGRDPVYFEHGLLDRVGMVGRAFWFYLQKLAWPFDLVTVYPRWEPGDRGLLVWTASMLALFAGLWALRGRLGKAPFALAAFYAVALAPTLGFLDFFAMIYSFVADRFQYLASLGPLAGAAMLLARLRPRAAGRALAAALVLGLGLLCFRQASIWTSAERLYRHNVERNPQAFLAWTNLGKELVEQGRVEEGIDCYHRSLELNRSFAVTHYDLGLALIEVGRPRAAANALRNALRANPAYAKAHSMRGVALDLMGETEQALEHYRRAVAVAPEVYEFQMNLGYALGRTVEYAEALECFDRALELRPGSADAIHMQGTCLEALGRTELAVERYRKALSIDPAHAAAQERLQALETASGG